MSKITKDSLTQSGTGCFVAAAIWQQLATSAQKYKNTTKTTVVDLSRFKG